MEINEVKLKEQGKLSRITNKTFKFDPKLGDGFYSANYFLKSKAIVENFSPNHIVTMQWFQRKDDVMLCGIDEAIALIHTFATNPETLEIYLMMAILLTKMSQFLRLVANMKILDI